MRFIAASKELFQALKKASSFLPSRSVLPVIENFKIEIEGDTGRVMASNLERGITVSFPCTSSEDFSFLARRLMMDTLGKLPDQPVTVSVGKTVIVKSSSGKFSFTPDGVGDYPEFPERSGEKVELDGKKIDAGIKKVGFCASKDLDKPSIAGVYMDNGAMVATDAHRLGLYDSGFDGNSVIIPGSLVGPISSLATGKISLSQSDNHLFFGFHDSRVWCRKIDKNYPDYAPIIPKVSVSAKVNTQELLSAVNRVNIYASDDIGRLRLLFKDGELEISAFDETFGQEASELVPVTELTEPFRKTLNGSLLADILSAIDQDQVIIGASDRANTPLVIVEEGCKYLLMPLMDVDFNN